MDILECCIHFSHLYAFGKGFYSNFDFMPAFTSPTRHAVTVVAQTVKVCTRHHVEVKPA